MSTIFNNEKVISESAELADSFLSRFLGLMGKTDIPPDYCLILTPCSSIHMAFMKIPLDVAYLDRSGVVIALEFNLQPWSIGKIHKGAYTVLEAGVEGMVRTLKVGDTVSWG